MVVSGEQLRNPMYNVTHIHYVLLNVIHTHYTLILKKRILDSLSGVEVDGHGVKTASARIGPLVWSGQQRFPNAKVDLYRQAVNLEQKAIFLYF